ncbi:MAG: hypothetical protein Q4A90_02670 [Streptococcus sp.]|nr:hypothetical protein [Streptococcus sp.]
MKKSFVAILLSIACLEMFVQYGNSHKNNQTYRGIDPGVIHLIKK